MWPLLRRWSGSPRDAVRALSLLLHSEGSCGLGFLCYQVKRSTGEQGGGDPAFSNEKCLWQLLMCVRKGGCECTHAMTHMWRSWDNMCGSLLSSTTRWIQEIKLRLSGMVAVPLPGELCHRCLSSHFFEPRSHLGP